MQFFLVYILFVIICPSTVANVLIYFSQVLMLPSYRTILVYYEQMKWKYQQTCAPRSVMGWRSVPVSTKIFKTEYPNVINFSHFSSEV